jgi:hypothetical protein
MLLKNNDGNSACHGIWQGRDIFLDNKYRGHGHFLVQWAMGLNWRPDRVPSFRVPSAFPPKIGLSAFPARFFRIF